MLPFLAAMIIAFLGIVIAIQNDGAVAINFLAWTVEGPLVMVLFLAFAGGAAISFLLTVPKVVRLKWRLRDSVKELGAKKPGTGKTRADEPKKDDRGVDLSGGSRDGQ